MSKNPEHGGSIWIGAFIQLPLLSCHAGPHFSFHSNHRRGGFNRCVLFVEYFRIGTDPLPAGHWTRSNERVLLFSVRSLYAHCNVSRLLILMAVLWPVSPVKSRILFKVNIFVTLLPLDPQIAIPAFVWDLAISPSHLTMILANLKWATEKNYATQPKHSVVFSKGRLSLL